MLYEIYEMYEMLLENYMAFTINNNVVFIDSM